MQREAPACWAALQKRLVAEHFGVRVGLARPDPVLVLPLEQSCWAPAAALAAAGCASAHDMT